MVHNLISSQMRVALLYLLDREGRGAQARLAATRKIDSGYLNGIIKGRKPGSEAIWAKIIDHFGVTYEDLLILGRKVQEKEEAGQDDLLIKTPVAGLDSPSEEKTIDGAFQAKSDVIVKAIQVLNSGTTYGDLLSELIESLHNAIRTDQENTALHTWASTLEQRVTNLENKQADAENAKGGGEVGTKTT